MKKYFFFFILFFNIKSKSDNLLIDNSGTTYNVTELAPHKLTFNKKGHPHINNLRMRLYDSNFKNNPVCEGILTKLAILETQENGIIKISFLKKSVYFEYLINPRYVTATIPEQFLMAIRTDNYLAP